MPLPEYYAERMAALDSFIRCPECDSRQATIEVTEYHSKGDDFRAICPECGHTTPWVKQYDH